MKPGSEQFPANSPLCHQNPQANPLKLVLVDPDSQVWLSSFLLFVCLLFVCLLVRTHSLSLVWLEMKESFLFYNNELNSTNCYFNF
jgi:hypothetical protein